MKINKTPWLKAGLIGGGVYFVLTVLSNIPCIGCLFGFLQCFGWFFIPFGVGYYAVEWSKITKDDYAQAAKISVKGGLVLGILNIINAFIGVLMGVIFNFGMNNFMLLGGNNTDYFQNSASLPFMATFGVLVVICFSFFGIFFDIILAVVGGIMNIALKKK